MIDRKRNTLHSVLTVFIVAFLSFPITAEDTAPPTEHLSPYGIKESLLIVAGKLPNNFEKTEEFKVLNVEKDTAPRGFEFLTKSSDEPRFGWVGLYVPKGAVVRFQKRSISNRGEGIALLKLAKSKNRPAREVVLDGKTVADYNEMRRCAKDRVEGSLYPPKQLSKPNVPKGTLMIIGGGGMTPEIGKAFIEAGGGEKGYFLSLPISMPDPIRTQREEDFLRRLGAKNFKVIPFREQKDLESPEVLADFKKATGIWFGGGRQWNFIDAYEGTQIPALMHDVLARGGVIGGSSAGATIQGDYLIRGAPAGPHIMMCEGYERGLGFLPGVGIDQHFSARKRFQDMTSFMKTYPQFLGIGLDEATAIVVKGSTAEILGKGKVHFYDYSKPIKDGEEDYTAYPAGTKYDLCKRQKIKESKPEK